MNHLNKKTFSFILTFLPPILAVLMGVTLFLALRFDFRSDIGHFSANSPFFLIFVGCAILSAVLGAGIAFFTSKKIPKDTLPAAGGIGGVIFSAGAAFSALLLFFMMLRDWILVGGFTLPAIGETILLPGISAFFVLGILSTKGSKLHGAAGLAACLSVNCLLFKSYFDFTLPLNSPIRNSVVVMEAALLISFLAATGSILGKVTFPVCCFARFTAVSLMGGISLGLVLTALFSKETLPAGVSVLRCVLCLLAAAAFLLQYPIPHENSQIQLTSEEQ